MAHYGCLKGFCRFYLLHLFISHIYFIIDKEEFSKKKLLYVSEFVFLKGILYPRQIFYKGPERKF